MQCLINQRTKLFGVIAIMESGRMHMKENRMYLTN